MNLLICHFPAYKNELQKHVVQQWSTEHEQSLLNFLWGSSEYSTMQINAEANEHQQIINQKLSFSIELKNENLFIFSGQSKCLISTYKDSPQSMLFHI
jgi:hypothetical protein